MLGAILGLGGGIFLVPVLTLLFDFSVRVAVGTSLVAVIATSAGVAAMSSDERGADIPLALRLEIATAAGAVVGGFVAGVVSARTLSLLFSLVVLGTAAYTATKGSGDSPKTLFDDAYRPRRWGLGFGVSGLAGIISGLLGVGGGFIKVPAMYAIMGVPLGVATATSNFMVGITAAASVFVYLGRGDIHPFIVAPTALGVYGGAVAGSWLLPHLKVVWLRWTLVVLMVAIGIQMVTRGFGN